MSVTPSDPNAAPAPRPSRSEPAPGLSPAVLDALRATVGEAGLLREPDAQLPYVTEQRGNYRGRAALVVRPQSTTEVAEVARILYAAGVAMVPQGGNTSLCGASTPSERGDEVVISLGRMNRVRALDAAGFTMTVEAGCVLADLQAAAAEADRLFPLSLAAEGSCQIGGNLSTNAGGTQVLRYGNARELVLGIEVVLPDGRVLDLLRGLRKDNTGYNLVHLFCGAEGTLGIITAAVLKLFPRPRAVATALLAVRDLRAALEILARARAATADGLTACEFIPRIALEFVLRHIPNTREPLPHAYPYYLLLEAQASGASGGTAASDEARLDVQLASLLEQATADGLVLDGVLAQSAAQAAELWRLRESISEAQKPEGHSLKHDVAVPLGRLARFVDEASAAVQAAVPGVRVVAFGHVGDGNVHFNLSQPPGMARAAFANERERLARIVHDLAMAAGGSFSAEHGVGRLKRDELVRYRSPVELEVMRGIKRLFDPKGLMNPGKVL
jgi:FAD/FMN-containing dehydrogenase